MQATILANCSSNIPEYTFLEAYLSDWSALFGAPHDQLPQWDRPGVASDRTQVQSCIDSPYHTAGFLAASSRHSGDWLFALPIASCGLKLDNEAVRVAIGLRPGLDICEPHFCRCGLLVDACGLHSLTCEQALGDLPDTTC